jgi:uncharacterized protein (TIGR03790 family)
MSLITRATYIVSTLFLSVFLYISPAMAITESSVLVVYNAASSSGLEIANYYKQVHPGVRLLGITGLAANCPDQITQDVYFSTIRPQVNAALNSSTDVIVTTKGLPVRIYNSGYPSAFSSLESELCSIATVTSRSKMPLPVENPYSYRYSITGNFSYSTYSCRLSSRLDGFTVADIEASIDRAQKAYYGRPGYSVVVDDSPTAPAASVDCLDAMATTLSSSQQTVVSDNTAAFIRSVSGKVLGYSSHGVYGPAPEAYLRDPSVGVNFSLAPGAIFSSYESWNAYTYTGSNAVASPKNQGLIAQWIADGGTAGVGNVEEPGVDSLKLFHEDVMYQMLLSGHTWVESAWNAAAQFSWVNTVVGDPLMKLKPWVTGDYDLDGDVDQADITAVRQYYGMETGDAGFDLLADMNNDGRIDFQDITIVKSHYTGSIAPSGNLPEPCTLTLLLPAFAAVMRRK